MVIQIMSKKLKIEIDDFVSHQAENTQFKLRELTNHLLFQSCDFTRKEVIYYLKSCEKVKEIKKKIYDHEDDRIFNTYEYLKLDGDNE